MLRDSFRPSLPSRPASLPVSLLGLALLGAALLVYACHTTPTSPPPPSALPLETFPNPFVRGFIVTVPAGVEEQFRGRDAEGIYLPGVDVRLRDEGTGSDVARVRTDLSGRYSFPRVAPGTYRVCWEMRGFVAGCDGQSFTLRGQPMLVPTIRIEADRAYPVHVWGEVRLRSGALRTLEPLFGVNSFGRVRLRPGGRVATDSAYVNTYGHYVLPIGSTADNAVLEAVVEALEESRILTGPLLQRVGRSHRADIVLNNHAPRPELLALVGGRHVRTAAPGSVVRLQGSGEDIDGDPLRFRWVLEAGAGTLSATTGAAVDWQLPNAGGSHRATLLVSDGRGGHRAMSASISTDRAGLGFSGRVDATDSPALPGATVSVNGVTAVTDTTGQFNLRVPEADRYVLNITRPGYNLVSRVYLQPVTSGRWTLTRGTTVSVDPRTTIDVRDARRHQRCVGPATSRMEWEAFPEAARPRRADRFGHVRVDERLRVQQLLQQPVQRECGPGARIRIPPNSLVDEDGNAPPGNVELTVFTVDLRAPFDMPGDYMATDRQAREGFMVSYGAAMVEVRDGASIYNLRPGATATLTIPIDPGQLAAPAAAPARVPLLRYDRADGIWRAIGELDRVGDEYEASVSSFSEFNADLVFTDPACVRIHSPQTATDFAGLPASYRIEVTVPQAGGAAPRVMDFEVTNTVPYHSVYSLPPNTDIVLVPYDPAANVPYGTFIVNTGATQSPVSPFRPAYDYGACNGQVTLYQVEVPPPGPDAYLHGLYSFGADVIDELVDPVNAADWAAATQEYYQRIDPRDLRTTFADFRDRNGFPTGEVRAIYANKADLGFGRDMHCVQKPATGGGPDDVACYVSNYGDHDTNDAQDFRDAVDGLGLVATVAMEYSRIENEPAEPGEFTDPDRVVKFYVYNAAGTRVTNANLDGRGARPIPQLCLVCHGGNVGGLGIKNFPDVQSVKLGARFIAFDLFAFTFDDGYDPAFDKSAQQAAFKQLNEMVLATSPGGPIVEMIDSMYPGAAITQKEDFIVENWRGNAGQRDMYLQVLRPTCRMCHASQPQSNLLGKDIRFQHASAFIALAGDVPARVCTQRVMPHALITHDSMWASLAPHEPAQLKAFGDAQAGGYGPDCGAPPVYAPTPPGTPVYDGDIGVLFNAQCTNACHVGPKAFVSQSDACNNGFAVMAQLIDLNAAAGYGSIVTVPSSQLPSMPLITPGNPDQSYLLRKLENTHAGPGGCGVQMPFGGTLSAAQIDRIRDWITQGAPKD